MKESTLATKIMIAVLCVGVLLYLGLYFILGFRGELATTVAYNYSVKVGAEANAIIVRDETVLTSSGTYVDQVLSEGERTPAGGPVVLIYSDSSALDTRREIRAVTAEIEQLEYALSTGTQSVDSAKLDQQVFGSLVNLRALSAGGDLSTLEESALNLRTMVFRRDYTYGDLGAAAQISQTISDLQDQLSALNRSLSRVSQTIYAPSSGVFSGEVDGYESRITPAMLGSITISELSDLIFSNPSAHSNGVGKVITSNNWYLAAIFDGGNEQGLATGRTYTISFSHDYYGNIPMTLERLETDGSRTMAIFSSRVHLSDTTLLRVQSVDIVVSELEGIRIPRKALRVNTSQVTDESGHTSAVNTYGVYTIVGSQAEWQSVDVLYTGDTYYLVEPVDEQSIHRLRAGDTIILTSTGMFDGKVVR